MILDHRHFSLAGRPTFERVRGEGPFRARVSMPDEACFYYLVNGRARTYASRVTVEHPAEEGLVLRCGNYLTDFLNAKGLGYFEVITVHFNRELLHDIFAADYPDLVAEIDRAAPTCIRHFEASPLFAAYMTSLEFYFEHPELVSDELQRLKLREIVLLLARTDQGQHIRVLIEELFEPVRADFRATVEANLFNPLSTEELALLTGRSLSSFKREFRRCYGTTPAAYVRGRKLDKARKLLSCTDLRITDVAYDCGFPDSGAFGKVFARAEGVGPREWRTRARANRDLEHSRR